MLDDEILVAIQEQNLSYFLLAQKMLAADRKMAMFRLHFNEEMADLIASLTTGQMLKLSNTGQLICGFSVQDTGRIKSILSNDRSESLIRTHMAMLLASSSNSHDKQKVNI